MADVKKLNLAGTEYDIKDATARQDIDAHKTDADAHESLFAGKIDKTSIVNDDTTGGATVPASAEIVKTHGTSISELSGVSMPIIYATTLQNAVNAVSISVDNAGIAYNLKRAELNIIIPAGSSVPTGIDAILNCKINDIATGYRDYYSGSDNATSTAIGAVRNVWAQIKTAMVCVSGGFAQQSNYYRSDGTTRNINTLLGGLVSGITSVSKIYFYLSGGYTFPSGTMIELRGQKA